MPDARGRRWRRPPLQTQVFFFIILGLVVYLSWLLFQNFLIYIITGIFVAVIALPIDKFWEKFFPNRVAAGFTMFSLLLVITVPLFVLGASMVKDVTSLASNLEDQNLDLLVNRTVERDVTRNILGAVYPGQNATQMQANLTLAASDGKAWLIDSLTQLGQRMIAAVPDIMIGMTVILMVVYYVLVDGERLIAWLRTSTPLPARQIDYLLRESRLGLNSVFLGQIMTCVIQGILGGIGFAITGLPNPVLWGAVMALLSLLPIVGSFLIWIPAGLYLLFEGNVGGAIFMFAWGALIVTVFMENLVKPKLMGRGTDIHPMLVLVGVLGGVTVFGFIGLFLGPLLVGVTIAVLNVYEADYLDPEVNLIDEAETTFPGGEPADPDTAPPKRR